MSKKAMLAIYRTQAGDGCATVRPCGREVDCRGSGGLANKARESQVVAQRCGREIDIAGESSRKVWGFLMKCLCVIRILETCE